MIIGHERIWKFLNKSAQSGKLAHAYLFVGPDEVGKKKVAIEFAKLLQCQNPKNLNYCGKCSNCLLIERNCHPDVLILEPNREELPATEDNKPIKSREIRIEQIRALQHQINLSPFSARRKIVIIDYADQMTLEAANCLLKTLEEPPQKSLLILVSGNWQRLLPTVISRCQLIKFLPVKSELIVQGLEDSGIKNRTKIIQAVRFACGRPGVALKVVNEPQFLEKNIRLIDDLEKLFKKNLAEKFKYAKSLAQNSVQAQEVLDHWLFWFRDEILVALGRQDLTVFGKENFKNIFSLPKIGEIIKNIEQTKKLLHDNSFNSRLVLENLMLKI